MVGVRRVLATLAALGAIAVPIASARAQTGTSPSAIVLCPSPLPLGVTPSPVATAAPNPAPSSAPTPTAVPTATPVPLGALRIVPVKPQLNVGMCARLTVSGGVPPYAPASAAGNVAAVAQPDGTVLVIALRNGTDTVIVIDANGRSASVPVLVAPDAGVLPATIALRLSGGVTADFEATALTSELARRSHLQPGARAVPIAAGALSSNLSVGAPWTGTVAVALSGRDRWRDVNGTVPVTIELVAMPQLDPAQLFYSDDPEKVLGAQAGVLFRTTLSADVPTARVFAYHEFEQTARRLYVLLRSGPTSHVQILGGGAGPSFTTFTGHTLTVRYLLARSVQQSVIATLDADPVVLEVGNAGEAQQLLTGLYDLRLIDGGPVDVAVVAGFDSGDPGVVTLVDAPPTTPPDKDLHDRAGVYPLDAVAPIALSASILDPKYRLSTAIGMSVRVGGWAVPPIAGKRYLGGDYGVVRQFRITLTNATDQPGAIYLYVAPSKAGSTTTMLFDGNPPQVVLSTALCLQGAQNAPAFDTKYLLKTFTVPPTRGGAPVVVTGQFMTDGGSSYPAELGLALDPPLPLPPKTMCVSPSPTPAPLPSPSPAPGPPASP